MYKYLLLMLTIFLLIQTQNVCSQTDFRTPNPYNSEHENVLIILDASYSMQESVNGERKIDIAKRAINQVLKQLSPQIWVGLRVYGHKTNFFGFNDCKASELKVAIGPDNQSLIAGELLKIKPVGWTPITYSIQQAIDNDFIHLSGKKRIILVSDGMETCGGSPCEYVLGLVRNHIDFKIDTIGFDIDNDAIAISQLKCTALATKGKFYSANNARDLADSLTKSLNTSKDVQGVILKK